ncbi:MAG: WG repeat-containing protein [Fibrobacteria bacterium]
MTATFSKGRQPILNGLLALGILLVFSAMAGLAATAVSGSAAEEIQNGSGEGGGARNAHGANCAQLRPQRIQGKYGYVDAAGKVVIAPRFDGADSFSEGLAVVLDSGRFGYIDSQGTFAIPPVYRHARAFRDGFAPVRFDGSWLTIDRGGKSVAMTAALPEPRR